MTVRCGDIHGMTALPVILTMLLVRITVLLEKWDITYNGFQENTHPTASGPPRSSGDLRSRELRAVIR